MNKYIDRFNTKYEVSDSGHWEWLGELKTTGYGRFWNGTIEIYAHRFSYELYVGEIPEGLFIDHLCRVRSCVNPEHLEPVTTAENLKRGEHRSDSTHCKHGHKFTPENTYSPPSQPFYRYCRECRRRRSAEQNIRDKQLSLR